MLYQGLLLVLLLTATEVPTDKNNKKTDQFWSTLQNKVQKLTPSKRGGATLAVAGVKGAKNDASDLYWKGKEKRVEINEDELQKFNTAIDARNKGDAAQALQHFEAFMSDFPNSSLRKEGMQAVEMLKAELLHRQVPPASPASSDTTGGNGAVPADASTVAPAISTVTPQPNAPP